jgi:hypothetical protein
LLRRLANDRVEAALRPDGGSFGTDHGYQPVEKLGVPLLHQKQCREKPGNALLASKQWHTIVAIQGFFNGLLSQNSLSYNSSPTHNPLADVGRDLSTGSHGKRSWRTQERERSNVAVAFSVLGYTMDSTVG